jgi:hypothetical protein
VKVDIPPDQISPSNLACLNRILDEQNDMVYVQRVPLMRLTIFTFAVLVATIPALAHSWYPLACCGNMDCFPVACDQLVETVSGWLYVPTGNLFKREQVQPSQDLHCHVCLGHGGDHRSICAFIVPNV